MVEMRRSEREKVKWREGERTGMRWVQRLGERSWRPG